MKMNTIYSEMINDKKIACYLSEPEPCQHKIVIMSHGFRSSSIGPARSFVDFSRLLIERGFSVLRFDQPNSGNSDGDFLNSSFKEWIDTTTFLSKKYMEKGYEVALMGQSMGATTSVVATARPEVRGLISCLILWVPDPKSEWTDPTEAIYEEMGQKYRGRFWLEAKESEFFECLDGFKGGILLVYGEKDRYISYELRQKVIKRVGSMGHKVMVLKGQDHSPWEYDLIQKVYTEGLALLEKYIKK
jgi:Serine aminopeptidase, S33